MTTGSLLLGCTKGMGKALGVSGLDISNEITYVEGSPNDVLTISTGSDIAFDGVNGQFYLGKGQNGSSWIKLGSTA